MSEAEAISSSSSSARPHGASVGRSRPFVAMWTLAVAATVAAFVLHLALRGRIVDNGYKLGRARAEQARLREVKRVLSLESASFETPARVEMVARTLLSMTPPPPERVIPLKPAAAVLPPDGADPGSAAPAAPVASTDGAQAAPSASAGAPVNGAAP